MTAIEHHELKGITVRNLFFTLVSTASIVASVMTTYFGLKTDIQAISESQQTEARINNIRIKVLEDHVNLLQKEVDQLKIADIKSTRVFKRPTLIKAGEPTLYSVATNN